MYGLRSMQINSINTSPAVPVSKATTPQATNTVSSDSDHAEFNLSADSFSSLVNRASQMPEVRTELVDAFKARIRSGQYPPQDTVASLSHVIGSGIMQAGKSASSAGNN